MKNFVQIIQVIFNTADAFMTKVIQTSPHLVKDPVQQEFIDKRNKTFLIVHIYIFILCLFDIFADPERLGSNLFRVFLVFLHFLFKFISCRVHPAIFTVYYTTICVIYGVAVIDMGIEGIHVAYLSVHMLPMFNYIFTGSYYCFLFQTLVQNFLLQFYYPPIMEKAVRLMTPEAFTHALTYSTHFTTFFYFFKMTLQHYLMYQAFVKINNTERKRNEAETQKTFLLSFSHELRNLINSLIGNVKLASLEKLNERTKELLLNAEVCGELLLHLVNNILDTGKVELGELEINPTPTRIYDALEKIWGVCSELIVKKSLRGCMRIQNNLPKVVMIDNYRLTQVFLNLVGNAIKYTERGFIDISVEWIEGKESVDISCFEPHPFNNEDDQDEGLFEKDQMFNIFKEKAVLLGTGSRRVNKKLLKPLQNSQKGVLKIIVRDTGCGIPKNHMDKLFMKFTQVTEDASKKKLGTGLGLFISKQLSTRMNGEIKAFSQENRGSSFIICLPIECAQGEDEFMPDIESLKTSITKKNLGVMMVDDLPFNHIVLRNYCSKLNIDVVDVLSNGKEAYEKYLEHVNYRSRPSIITMDLDMPIMDGKEASEKIRQLEADRNLSPCFLLIISGNCTESEIRQCMDRNGKIRADGFLKKPVNLDELVRVIGKRFLQMENYA